MPADAPCRTEQLTGMALSVFSEIATMLEQLASDGSTGAINLRSLPLTAADRGQLEELLGRGEVEAELEIGGRSTVRETAYAGAWWISHHGAGGTVSSEEIAICRVPDILVTHESDIRAAAGRIRDAVSNHSIHQPEANHG